MKTKKQTGYMHRITAAFAKNPDLLPKGSVLPTNVKHGTRCQSADGESCNCFPAITITTPAGTFSIGHDGTCQNVN